MNLKRLAVGASLAIVGICVALLAPAAPTTDSLSSGATVHAEPAATVAPVNIPSRTVTAIFPSGAPAPPRITSKAAFMIDADTGDYLFSHNANARLPNASTTKIMTAILALESLELSQQVTISRNAVSTIGSKSRLVAGETLTIEQLLYALMVVSGNDASIALAEAVSGSVAAFVEKMNARADELGLTNTHFVNTCGLNNKKHFASAKDLAFLAQHALRDPVFARIVDTIDFALPPIPAVPPATEDTLREFDNQNELLKQMDWATGVKTGSTPYAKYCLVTSGMKEGVSLIAVVLGAQEDATRWKEARALLEYGLSLYPRTLLVGKGELIAEVDVADPIDRPLRLVTDRPLLARLSQNDEATSRVTLLRDLSLPIRAGEIFGTMDFVVDGTIIGSVDLIAASPVERPSVDMVLEHLRTQGPYYDWLADWNHQ